MTALLPRSLVDLDFSENDALVYLAVLASTSSRTPSVTAGPIIAETGLHRNIVYTSLRHLISRKLVEERMVRGRKNFSLSSPAFLEEEFVRKAALAKEVANRIAEQMPKPDQQITVHHGNGEYLALLTSLLRAMPKGRTKYVLGCGGEEFMAETMRPIWRDYHEVAASRRMKIRMIGYEGQRDALETEVAKEEMYEVRFLPDALVNPAGLHIYPEADTVLNIVYSSSDTPVTAVRIRQAGMVGGYLNLFRNLWKQAKR